MRRGILAARPDAEVDLCPIADGGEGTVSAMMAATGGYIHTSKVMGPLVAQVEAQWGMFGGDDDTPFTAVIEMAAASGLALIPPDERNPMLTTSFGTGQLMAEAIRAGAERIILGIGGSATNDCGCGAAAALGVVFLTGDEQVLLMPPTGGSLSQIAGILVDEVTNFELTVACDVENPLTGPNGAAHVYGPQKGASPQQVEILDRNLSHIASLIKRDLGVDVEHMPGGGAAGGMGAGMSAFFNAELLPGAKMVLDAVCFDQRVSDCDLCLTGEGRIDGQTLSGKAIMAVTEAASSHDVNTIALAGSIGPEAEKMIDAGLSAYHEICAGLPAEESMRRAAKLLEKKTAEVVSLL